MAWETRKGRGRYYTRSSRVGGRVVREYLGVGPAAEQAAREDAQERLQRLEGREAFKSLVEELQAAGEAVERFSAGVRAYTEATLEAAGYHRHHRGEWRRRNG